MTNENLSNEKFTDEDGEEDAPRPELSIAPKDRKLLTQPFDFIVGSLEEQISDGQLVLQDEFQRRQVWDDKKCSRLIESLLLNVPIPVCYFAELKDGTFSVIDGQQRLTSISRYLTNLYPLSGLRVRPELNKRRFSELDKSDQRLIKTRTIRCIVIQQESHPDIRFDVFERLNQGAVKLTAQELRNSNYRGDLNKLIKELCRSEQFQKIRRVQDVDARMGDAEMVLRFFAFHFAGKSYRGFFAPFLDKYLEENMTMSPPNIEEHRKLFSETIDKVDAVFDRNAFRQISEDGRFANQINRAIYDVIMLTFAHIEKAVLQQNAAKIVDALKKLCTSDKEFQDAIGRATRDRARINSRVRLWVKELNGLGIACPILTYGG
ncbi:DUF262 domain-containing protein (plasmid) [Bradyrhizobium sp. 62B]|uniref:DUF262 domain-containing protein n=1 Tax=Bradyrhizobium sp. 62B TaxID=2898442 RepID=UPI00255811E1|nr:DUF262 domain-containing protein [Bradyrhizobium sp. 62B]